MGCTSCKKKTGNQAEDITNEINPVPVSGINNLIFKLFMFFIALFILPLTIPLIIWMLFKTIVLSDSTDLMPVFLKIGNWFKKKDKDDDIEDEEEFNDENYELTGVDIIK